MTASSDRPLWQLHGELQSRTFTDLTHAFFPGMPHFPAFPDEVRSQTFQVDPDGFAVHL